MIADIYNPVMEIPEGFETRTIPEFTWAVFSCDGPMPTAIQDVNKKIFSEWLPALKEYEFAAGYCVEMYDAPVQVRHRRTCCGMRVSFADILHLRIPAIRRRLLSQSEIEDSH